MNAGMDKPVKHNQLLTWVLLILFGMVLGAVGTATAQSPLPPSPVKGSTLGDGVYLSTLSGIASLDEMKRVFDSATVSAQEQAMIDAVNRVRATNHLDPVSRNDRLVAAAHAHALDMAQRNFFSHTGSDGSSPSDRVLRFGYSYRQLGEIIAGGQLNVEEVINAWLNSPGHRAILLGVYLEVGAGWVYLSGSNYGNYWVMEFASPYGGLPPPLITATPPSLPPTRVPVNTPSATQTPVASGNGWRLIVNCNQVMNNCMVERTDPR